MEKSENIFTQNNKYDIELKSNCAIKSNYYFSNEFYPRENFDCFTCVRFVYTLFHKNPPFQYIIFPNINHADEIKPILIAFLIKSWKFATKTMIFHNNTKTFNLNHNIFFTLFVFALIENLTRFV